ncbi:hypothetical protein B0T21DRAFT_347436 [Apiosordaria backusii]|uniref:Uncharacterized protein n=1 Tax=Apiosordaria backusii TaxID=314023 RepID=A0AA40BML8_9PEZI|nr:hypothetical protein B0T21DRAFT_347436 [Apiosordaria backusii]
MLCLCACAQLCCVQTCADPQNLEPQAVALGKAGQTVALQFQWTAVSHFWKPSLPCAPFLPFPSWTHKLPIDLLDQGFCVGDGSLSTHAGSTSFSKVSSNGKDPAGGISNQRSMVTMALDFVQPEDKARQWIASSCAYGGSARCFPRLAGQEHPRVSDIAR